MKKFSKLTRSLVAMLVCLIMAFSFAACGKNNGGSADSTPSQSDGGSTKTDIQLQMQLSKSAIAYKEEAVRIMVIVTGSNAGYDIRVKDAEGYSGAAEYIEVLKDSQGYSINVTKSVPDETKVVVEAIAKDDTSVKDSKELTIKANADSDVSITAEAVDAKKGGAHPNIRKGDDVELKVNISTKSNDKTFTIKVENPSDMPDLVSVVEKDGVYKIVVNEDVTENKNVKITVVSNANPKKSSTIQISVKPPRTGDKVGDLTQAAINKLDNLKLRVSGTLSDIVTKDGNTESDDYLFKTYLNAVGEKETNDSEYFSDYVFESATWHSEWNVKGNKNVLANTYTRGEDGLTRKVFVNKNNVVSSEVVTDSYSNQLSWDSQHYWNHLGYLDLSKFEQEGDSNVYVYEMDYGTINYDPILGTGTYAPSEDEYLMMYLAWSLTPMLSTQFYTFKVELDPTTKEIVKLYGETYPNAIYDTDDEGSADKQVGVSYTKVEINIEAYGDDIDMPEIAPYTEPTGLMAKTRFEYLKNALSTLNGDKIKNYSFKMKETTTSAPSFDPNDYTVSGSDGESAPGMSASGKWDGKVQMKNYTSDTGEVGYIGIVTKDGILINKTGEYSNGGYHTEVYGYKQNDDNTYEAFEYSKGLYGKSKKQGSVSSIIPTFDVSPYIFEFASMNKPEGSDLTIYSFALKDSIIIEDVAKEFCIADYARYASGSVTRSFMVNIAVDEETGSSYLVGVTFAYNVIDTYLGYYETVYSDFGNSKLPEGIFSEENYTPRHTPESWNDFTNSEYFALHTMKTGDGEAIKAGDLIDKVFGKNAAGVAASATLPSPKVFADLFCDNFSSKIWHDWFATGNLIGTEKEYKSMVNFNVWLDDGYTDSNSRVSKETYDELMVKLDAEMAKCGFTVFEAGTYSKQSSDGSSVTRMKGYINDNAGANGMMIKVENLGYRTFYIEIYEKGDWNPSK